MTTSHNLLVLLNAIYEDWQDINVSLRKTTQSELLSQTQRSGKNIREAITQANSILQQFSMLQSIIQQSALMNSSLDLEQVLKNVVATVVELTGARRAYLMLRDEHSGELSIRAQHNWENIGGNSFAAQYSRSVMEQAIQQQTPIVTVNAQSDQRFDGAASISAMHLLSIICIPLHAQGKIVGALYADSNTREGIFKEDIVPLLAAIGMQATIAIQNASAFQQVKQDLEQVRQEVQRLQIQVDQQSAEDEFKVITESDWFQHLESIADDLRSEFDKE